MQKDLGSSLLFFVLFVVMLWVATGRTTYLTLGGTLFLAGATFAYSQFSHVRDRVEVWLDPWPVAADECYQIVHATYALADGGIAGTGLYRGPPTPNPDVETTLNFAALATAHGLLGSPPGLAPSPPPVHTRL